MQIREEKKKTEYERLISFATCIYIVNRLVVQKGKERLFAL